jgi:hypothetical protein
MAALRVEATLEMFVCSAGIVVWRARESTTGAEGPAAGFSDTKSQAEKRAKPTRGTRPTRKRVM